MINLMIATSDEAILNEICDGIQQDGKCSIAAIAQEGKEMLDILSERKDIDAIIMDAALPNGNSEDVQAYLKQRDKTAAVLSIAPQSLTDIMYYFTCQGAQYVMMRPIYIPDLVKRIKLVGEPEQTEQNVVYQKPCSPYAAQISTIMRELGVPMHIIGYRYIKEALEMILEDVTLLNDVTKRLYPQIAESHQTTWKHIERAIRYTVECTFDRGNLKHLHKVFGYTVSSIKGKPTNREFLAMIADRLMPL